MAEVVLKRKGAFLLPKEGCSECLYFCWILKMSLGRTESDMLGGIVELEVFKASPVNVSVTEDTSVYCDVGQFSSCFRHLAAMRMRKCLCDVVLVAKSEDLDEACDKNDDLYEVYAHRCILVASSPYFAAMFNSSMVEADKKIIHLKGIDGDSLEAIVDFIYTGRLKIKDGNVQKLFTASSIFQILSLQDACGSYLRDQLDPTNCLGMVQFASSHGCMKLYSAAMCYARQHFWELVGCEEFLSLNKDRLSELISFDHLNTNGEENVYEAILRWIEHDITNRLSSLSELMSHVRMRLVTRQYLTKCIDPNPWMRESSECKDYLLEAYRYHLIGTFDEQNERYRPRMPVAATRSIMLVGGQAPKAITNVDVLDLDSGSCISVNDLPQRRCRCGVTVLNEMVYAIGGFNGSMRVRTADVFNVETGRWFAAPLMNERRSTLGVATAGNRIYAVGGYDGNTGLCSAEAFDPRTGEWTPLPLMSVRRSSVGVAAVGDVIFAIGGFDGNCKQSLSAVEFFDIRMNQWRPGPSMNLKRSGAAVATFGKNVFAIGGHDGPDIRACAEVLVDGAWKQCLPLMSTPRRNASALCIDSTLYVIGGEDGKDNLDSIEAVDVSSFKNIAETWSELGVHTKQPKSYCGSCLLPKPLGKEVYSESYQANTTSAEKTSPLFY